MNVTRLPPSNPNLPCFVVEYDTGGIALFSLDEECLFEYHPDVGTVEGEIDIDDVPTIPTKLLANITNASPEELHILIAAWKALVDSGSMDRPPLPSFYTTDADGEPFVAEWIECGELP